MTDFCQRQRICGLLACAWLIIACSHEQAPHLTHNPGYRVIANDIGIQVENHGFRPDLLYPKKVWKGDWIWLDRATFAAFQHTKTRWGNHPAYTRQYKALFRKNFHLAEIPPRAFLSISADISFRVYINGAFVAAGPPDTGSDYNDGLPPQHRYFTTQEVKRFLSRGRNTIAVEVFSSYHEISESSSGKGMLICDLDKGLNETFLATDTSWKCNVDTSFLAFRRRFAADANMEPSGWERPSFDDAQWKTASIVAFRKDGYLSPSHLPVPFRYPVEPVGIWTPGDAFIPGSGETPMTGISLRDTAFTLDYGRNITAFYGFEVIARQYDTLIIHPYEAKYASRNRSLVFVCREGQNVFHAPYLSVFRYLNLQVRSDEGLVIRALNTDFSSYPLSYTGTFACSDSMLTRLWDITRWTTQLCMNDMFYDSPKHQEPIACTGDYLIHSLINYYAFGDPWLTRQTLIKTALMLEKNDYDMFHTSYSLLWIQMLKHYFNYTGDIQCVRDLLPHVNRLNRLFETYLNDQYLVSNAPDYMFMDWVLIDEFNAHHPPAVIGMGYMTALYYKALLDAADLNVLAGNSGIEERNRELAGKIKAGMNTHLLDREKQCYRDGIPFISNAVNHRFLPEDKDIVTHSPHVNTLATLYDIAPEAMQPALLDYVIHQEEIEIQPYFMYFVLAAVSHLNRFETEGLALLRRWKNGVHEETHTLKENWQAETETGYEGDYSHAWGGSPLYFMSSQILGVRPSGPGYAEIEIRPFIAESIEWARGTVPLTNDESLTISWQRTGSNRVVYDLDIPGDKDAYLRITDSMRREGFTINGIPYPPATERVKLRQGNNQIEY